MKTDVFHIGPQKTATTWVYQCLKEHEEIAVPKKDAIHYYDMFYSKGKDWHETFYRNVQPNQIILDPTPSYIRSTWAPRRIARDHPNAKFIICLRNPIDRAFSHYWHEKKKQKIAFEFKEVLENYDLYTSWIEPGLYAEHIERYLRYFEMEQFLFLKFEDLKRDPKKFLKKILVFIGVSTNFTPSLLDKKSNAATGKKTIVNKGWHKLKRTVIDMGLEKPIRKLNVDKAAKKFESFHYVGKFINNKDEYERGMPEDIKTELFELIEPEIERLEDLLNIKLESWRS